MIIYTIGHSTHSINNFIEMLQAFDVKLLADIRNYPGSKRYPHFNKENLESVLPSHKIEYKHFKALGGRRKPITNSINTGWRVEAFRGYADYMATEDFNDAVADLSKHAATITTAYMCSEAVWWSCHRSLLSDHFKHGGWKVLHIMSKTKADEHPYTKPAKIINGNLCYPPDNKGLLF